MSNLKEVRYDAFISYRHMEPDSYVAQRIHRKLEGFKLPHSVKKKTDIGKTKISRIFRDEEELPLSKDLSTPINQALENSDYLICICTPNYPESLWCTKEIEVFLQTHDRSHILVVLAEGEPADSFPEILTHEDIEVQDEDGSVRIINREIEPLAADTRGENKKEIDKKMDTAILKLSAAIFGLNYDDLRQRHREAKLKRIITLSACIGACLLAFGVFATLALIRIGNQNTEISQQNREINEQNITISNQFTELQDKYADQMSDYAKKQLSLGRRKDAVSALVDVLPETESEPHNTDALATLYDAMDVYGIEDLHLPVMTYDMDSEIVSFYVSFDGRYIMLFDDLNVRVFEVESGKVIMSHEKKSTESEDSLNGCFCGSEGFIIVDGEESVYYSLKEEGYEKPVENIGQYSSVYHADDGEITLTQYDDIILGINHEGEIRYRLDTKKIFGESGLTLASVKFDDGRFACTFTDYTRIFALVADEKNGKLLFKYNCKCAGDSRGALRGNVLCFSAAETGAENPVTTVFTVDISSGKKLWETEIQEYIAGDIVMGKKRIFVHSEIAVVDLNAQTGKSREIYYCDEIIITGWLYDGGLYYLSYGGKLYESTDGLNYQITDSYFKFNPAAEVRDAVVVGDDMFICNDLFGYVSRQTLEKPEGAERLDDEYKGRFSEYDYDFYTDTDTDMYVKDVLKGASDINISMVDTAFYSMDKKLILAVMRNHEAQIIDASTLKYLQTIDFSDEAMFEGFRFSEVTGTYVVETGVDSLILDKDYNIVVKTSRIVDEDVDENALILRNYESGIFRVPYVSYEELIRRAKEMVKE